jgi:ribosomal-protein-alanine N-acetyltransferase
MDISVKKPLLRGNRLLLRAPLERDKADRLSYGRDPEFRRMVGGDHRVNPPLTVEEVDRWYQAALVEPHSWVIDLNGKCIGQAALHSHNALNRCARYAIGIFDPACWSQGYGVEATRLVLLYAFETLKLHRVDLRVLEFNHRAIRCYEKCGFVREGMEREGAFIAGEWQSDVIMSILEQEYQAIYTVPKSDRGFPGPLDNYPDLSKDHLFLIICIPPQAFMRGEFY